MTGLATLQANETLQGPTLLVGLLFTLWLGLAVGWWTKESTPTPPSVSPLRHSEAQLKWWDLRGRARKQAGTSAKAVGWWSGQLVVRILQMVAAIVSGGLVVLGLLALWPMPQPGVAVGASGAGVLIGWLALSLSHGSGETVAREGPVAALGRRLGWVWGLLVWLALWGVAVRLLRADLLGASLAADVPGIGDVIVDSVLSIEGPGDLSSLLGRDSVRGCLLELVHGGGLRIRDGVIELTPPSELEALDALVDQIGELGAAVADGSDSGA